MRRIIILISFLLPISLFSQSNVGAVDPELLQTVISINNNGTGFLVEKGKKLYLITNKHVIGEYNPIGATLLHKSITIFMYSDSSSIPIEVPISRDNVKPLPYVQLHPDPAVDVAAINITHFALQHKAKLNRLDVGMLTPLDSFVTAAQTGVGDLVFAIGYPLSIKDSRTNQPILKAGYIASPIHGKLEFKTRTVLKDGKEVNYILKGKIFLVDGLITFGNSGGPIIAHKGMRLRIRNSQIEYYTAPQNLVLGIVSQGLVNSGITVIFSSDCILEVLDLFP